MVYKLKDNLPWLITLLPIIAFLFSFFSEHNKVKADIEELTNDRSKIEEKLDRISEKLNIIDGKISEHMRVSQ